MSSPYDAVLLVSFGGPEGADDVVAFLENVVRGKNVPRQRILQAAAHYDLFDGISPINAQNRALLSALSSELGAHRIDLPIYWGNRNWHPLLRDTMSQMADRGVRRVLGFFTSAFSSYSGCRQYLEDIRRTREEVGSAAPTVDKLRVFYNHPGFIEAMAESLSSAFAEIPPPRRPAARIVYTAHSLPLTMARNCAYEEQLGEACRLVSERAGRPDWQLVYQDRSGPPAQPWLEPDVGEHLCELARRFPGGDVVIVPIGFVCEHMEIVYSLDVSARAVCEDLGLNMVRAGVVGCHPRFVAMVRELIQERIDPAAPRLALGSHGPFPDRCPPECCLPG